MASFMLPQYPTFDCQSEGVTIRWSKWINRLKNLFTAYNITNVEQKKALLLTYGGEKLNDQIESLSLSQSSTTAAETEGEDPFSQIVKQLTSYFNPKMNVEMQKYTFRHKIQQSTHIEEFYQDLYQLAKTCNFTNAESEIKSQLIVGCKSSKVREKGLSTPEMSLNALLQYAKTIELAEDFNKRINNDQVQKIGTNTTFGKKQHKRHDQSFHGKERLHNISCRNCGGKWPHPGGQSNSPAHGKTCHNCRKVNHFSSMCKNKLRTDNKHKEKKQDSRIHNLEDDDSTHEYVFSFNMKKNMPRVQLNMCIDVYSIRGLE